MATVNSSIIAPALREIGVIAPGEAPAYDDANDALSALNRLLDQHALDRLQLYTTTRATVNLNADQSEYLLLNTGGISGDLTETADGFDTGWAGVPPGWTVVLAGDAAVTNDTTSYQAGGHSVKILGTTGAGYIYRDFETLAGRQHTITLYTKAGFTSTGQVSVQNTDTLKYLNSSGVWQSVETFIFTSPAGSTFTLKTQSFVVEPPQDVGTNPTTLRVSLIGQATTFGAWFDTFTLDATDRVSSARPVFIDHVNVVDLTQDPAIEYPMTQLTEDAWAGVVQKDMTTTRPMAWYYNPTFPGGTLTVWPVPSVSTMALAVYVLKQVPKFEALTDTFTLPQGYERMLITNLALELCPSYEKTPHPILVKNARESMAAVKTVNRRPADLQMEAAALIGTTRGASRYNILIDQ